MSVDTLRCNLLTSEQVRAARAMLRWEQSTLAAKAGVSVETIKRLERANGPLVAGRLATIQAIEKAFAKAGVEFIDDDAPGVRLRAKKK